MRTRLLLPLVSLALIGAGCSIPGLGGPKTPAKGPDGGLWRSENTGKTWAQAVAVPGPKGVGTMAGTNVTVLTFDPQDPSVAYAGTRENGLFLSEDGTASWRQAHAESLRAGAIVDVAVDPKDACTVYVARGNRVLKSVDCLRSVDDQAYVEPRAKVSVTALVVDWYNPNVVWIGLSNGDVLQSTDKGKSWRTSVSTKSAVTQIMLSRADSRQMLIGTDGAGFFRTLDAGKAWTQVTKELKDFRNATKVAALVQDKDSGTVVAATGYGLIRSRDFGATWEGIKLLTSPGQTSIRALAMDPAASSRLWYAAAGTFYASTDDGVTWATDPLPTARIPQLLTLDPKNASVLYLAGAAEVKK
ncbi:hypothetical protein EPO34_01780 [Patescibacteria group bacterium]|nr:MAG: hypothetical protein EPO34_01780 [Patescibacteria group bacterium]